MDIDGSPGGNLNEGSEKLKKKEKSEKLYVKVELKTTTRTYGGGRISQSDKKCLRMIKMSLRNRTSPAPHMRHRPLFYYNQNIVRIHL
jgi:hypothetical protein